MSSVAAYKSTVPVAYGSTLKGGRKIQMGTIGNARRFYESKYRVESPGVGAYNLAGFKNISKASETFFSHTYNSEHQNGNISTQDDTRLYTGMAQDDRL